MQETKKEMLARIKKEHNLSDQDLKDIYSVKKATTELQKINAIEEFMKDMTDDQPKKPGIGPEDDEDEEEVGGFGKIGGSKCKVHLQLAKDLEIIWRNEDYKKVFRYFHMAKTIPTIIKKLKAVSEVIIN